MAKNSTTTIFGIVARNNSTIHVEFATIIIHTSATITGAISSSGSYITSNCATVHVEFTPSTINTSAICTSIPKDCSLIHLKGTSIIIYTSACFTLAMSNFSGIFLTICKNKCFVFIYDNSVTVTCITSNTISIQTKVYIIITCPCSLESDRLCQIITAILCYITKT